MIQEDQIWFYYNQGFSIFPLKATIPPSEDNKKPNISSIKPYYERRPSKEEVETWISKKLFKNIAIACGAVSGNLVVIDIDNENAVELLGLDLKKIADLGYWIVKTGKKNRYQIYCKHKENPGGRIPDATKLDFRANGCYIVAPPSIHPNGKEYKFLFVDDDKLPVLKVTDAKKLFATQVRDLRKKLGIKEEKVAEKPGKKEKGAADCITKILLDGTVEGKRKDTTYALASWYKSVKKISNTEIIVLLLAWNKKNKPALETNEINDVVNSIRKTEKFTGCTRIKQLGFCPYKNQKDCHWFNPEDAKLEEEFKHLGKREIDDDLCASCQFFYGCGFAKADERNGIVTTKCDKYKDVAGLPYKSLDDVYNAVLKYYPRVDVTRIDTRLAWYISNETEGDQINMAEITRTGALKTTLSNAFKKVPKVIMVGDITPAGMVSLKDFKGKPVPDLGMRLTNRHRALTVSETAGLKAQEQGQQRALFSLIKQLFDRHLGRSGGSGIEKNYPDCYTALWMNSTPDFRKHLVILQEVGTCLLIDAPNCSEKDDDDAMEQAFKNAGKEEAIKNEIQYVTNCFSAHHHYKNRELTADEEQFIKNESQLLKVLRTTCGFDVRDELEYIPESEVPARVAGQLRKMYLALLSLDDSYKEETARKIIQRIVDSSCDPILVQVLNFLNTYWIFEQAGYKKETFSVWDVLVEKGHGRGTIKRRLELLVGMGYLDKAQLNPGEKGGRPGIGYQLSNNISEEKWMKLFRYSTKEEVKAAIEMRENEKKENQEDEKLVVGNKESLEPYIDEKDRVERREF